MALSLLLGQIVRIIRIRIRISNLKILTAAVKRYRLHSGSRIICNFYQIHLMTQIYSQIITRVSFIKVYY